MNSAAVRGYSLSTLPLTFGQARLLADAETALLDCMMLGADQHLVKAYLITHPESARQVFYRLAAGELPELYAPRVK